MEDTNGVSYGQDQMFINREEIEDILTCQICFEIKECPRLLTCHHSFCQKCLTRFWEDPPPGRKISCATCRQITVVPQQGIAGLQSDFYASKLMQGVGDDEPLIPSKRPKTSSTIAKISIVLLGLAMAIVIIIVCTKYFLTPELPDSKYIISSVPGNRGIVPYKNNTIFCIGDSQDGKVNMTLVSITSVDLRVQKVITVGLEPANLKNIQDDQVILVDKHSGSVTKWSMPDIKQTSSYSSIFSVQNQTILGNIVRGDSLYVLFFKGTIARFLIEDMTLVEQYSLDKSHFKKGDYFLYMGPLHVYRGGLEDSPFINVFNMTNGSYVTSIDTDCYRRPYARDGYVGSKSKSVWELRDATTLNVVLRADFSAHMPPGRTLIEQKVRFGVFEKRLVAVFTSFFGLVFDLKTKSVIKKIELNMGNVPPHPVNWVNDKEFVVGFKDNTIRRFVL